MYWTLHVVPTQSAKNNWCSAALTLENRVVSLLDDLHVVLVLVLLQPSVCLLPSLLCHLSRALKLPLQFPYCIIRRCHVNAYSIYSAQADELHADNR